MSIRIVDWSKAPVWADRHVWGHDGKGEWLGWRMNDWINTYPIWESESQPSGIEMPANWNIEIPIWRQRW